MLKYLRCTCPYKHVPSLAVTCFYSRLVVPCKSADRSNGYSTDLWCTNRLLLFSHWILECWYHFLTLVLHHLRTLQRTVPLQQSREVRISDATMMYFHLSGISCCRTHPVCSQLSHLHPSCIKIKGKLGKQSIRVRWCVSRSDDSYLLNDYLIILAGKSWSSHCNCTEQIEKVTILFIDQYASTERKKYGRKWSVQENSGSGFVWA